MLLVVRLLALPGDRRVLADAETAELMERLRIGKVLDQDRGRPPMREPKTPRR